MQPVLSQDCRVCEPRPPLIGIIQKLPVYKGEHLALLGLVRDLSIELGCHQQWILSSGIELQNALQPREHLAVIKLCERDADARLVIEGLQVQSEGLCQGNRISSTQDAKHRQ